MRGARWLVAAAVMGMGAGSVDAQTCAGKPSFAAGGSVVDAGATFTDGANHFGAGFGMGSTNGLYGSASLGTTSYDVFDGSSFDVGAAVGYQVPLGTTGAVQLCPTGEFSYGFGPHDIQGTGIDASQWSMGFGLQLGTAVSAGPKVAVLPNGSLAFAYSKAKLKDPSGASLSGSDSYGILGLGLGFVFNSRVGLTPTIAIPVGLEGGDPVFGVNLSLNFGPAR